MSADPYNELADLAAQVQEHLRLELEMGPRGLPPAGLAAAGLAAAGLAAAGLAPAGLAPAAPAGASGQAQAAAAPPEPVRSTVQGVMRLSQLEQDAAACTRCRLHEQRTRSVFARGNPAAELVFVGEGPGYHEDQQGKPFVGPAGQLLDRMISAMGLTQQDVYICNVVKCRPPENRTPNPDEAAACRPFLEGQLEIVGPKAIVALGRCAAEGLGVVQPASAGAARGWRGRWGSWRDVPVMSTYHPAYLLRSPEQKRPVWEDLQQVVLKLGRQLPAGRGTR